MLRISKEHCITGFGPRMHPVAEAAAGDNICFETYDCWHGQIVSAQQEIGSVDFSSLNPATGPVRILGAAPGDALIVRILNIKVAETGVMNIIPGAGVLGDKIRQASTRILPVANGYVRFDGLLLKSRPMIGVIGLATSNEAGSLSTGTPGRHGGNMDTSDIRKGVSLYLPVNQPGGMLALGDVHALMGDGEVCVTGCEVGAEVTVQVDIKKGLGIAWPVIETEDSFMIVASGADLDEAARLATESAVNLISTTCAIPWEDAYMLASLIMDLRISQCVDPLKTVRAVLPKNIFPQDKGLTGF